MAFVPDSAETASRFVPDGAAVGGSLPSINGMVNFGASALGTPVDTIENILNLARAGVGTVATAAGRPDLAPDLQRGSVGGSQWLKDRLRATGVPSLSPDNPTPQSDMGKFQYDLAARGGFIPGGAMPAAASIAAEKIGGPQWAGVGAMLPTAGIMAYNELTAPSRAAAQAQNQVRDATLKKAQDAGYVLPPSQVNPGVAGNTLESFAGKAALNQEAAIKNQQVTNKLVREELNVPANTPITEGTLNNLRDKASAPYQEIASMSPSAKTALERLRDVRSEAKDQWRHWDMQGVPEAKRQAVALDQKADMLERFIERQATMVGKPDLVPQLRDARTYIAKTYDVERALNLGNGNVDAQIIGRALDRGKPLSGNLETIAQFAEGPGRQFVREGSKVPTPGVSALNWPAAAVLGTEGAHYFGPKGVALAAIPFVRGGVRQGILSAPYQRNFAVPNYDPAMQPENMAQALLRQGIIANQ